MNTWFHGLMANDVGILALGKANALSKLREIGDEAVSVVVVMYRWGLVARILRSCWTRTAYISRCMPFPETFRRALTDVFMSPEGGIVSDIPPAALVKPLFSEEDLKKALGAGNLGNVKPFPSLSVLNQTDAWKRNLLPEQPDVPCSGCCPPFALPWWCGDAVERARPVTGYCAKALSQ